MRVDVRKPALDADAAAALVRRAYGIDGSAAPLAGERDASFAVEGADGRRYILKVAPADEPADAVALEVAALEHLGARQTDLALPRIVRDVAGTAIHTWSSPAGEAHAVRLLTWVPGEVWARVRPHTPALRRSLGAALGRLRQALDDFTHPAAARDFPWDLTRAGRVRDHTGAIADGRRRGLVESILARTAELAPDLARLPQAVLYHDANDWNVIVAGDGPGREVGGFVDFGDMVTGPSIIDLALAIAYGSMGTPDPVRAAADIVAGYRAEVPVREAELNVLLPLVRARLAFSVTFSAARSKSDGTDAYLGISAAPAWGLLERFAEVHDRFAEYVFRAAAELEPCPASPRVRRWLERHQRAFTPVLELGPETSPPVIDLSIESTEFGTPAELDDLERTSRAIRRRIDDAGGGAGIGRWNEVRAIYRANAFRVAGNERDEYRTVHLGLDLFARPGTAVRAPLDGVVHSFRNNVGRYDYGPAIVLEHRVRDEEGELVFHTLYGHLGAASLGRLGPGELVRAGTVIADIGDARVNGGWPPHVHVQVVCDLLGHEGTFPGVAGVSDRAVWLSLSPDPGALAGPAVTGKTKTPPATDPPRILEGRRARLGPSLSISYREPLHVVRGWMQTLYDAGAQPYLDCVNNVAHVGHCHPRVVRAAAARKAVLETNTRYLHEDIVHLAERLAATLPRPLDVCFFVNSGSEANELALRMARAATGRRGVVVIDGGYHGNTTTIIDVSPYKHDGPGGSGPPGWVRKIPMPDPYRGVHRGEADSGVMYAGHVDDAVATLRRGGHEPCALLAESILSCGGQIVPPAGFLPAAYANARAAGALCIADEVQTGLGRVGDAFWAFELQGVVPDIVTIGKPFGNGHPLAAVVTTRAIADAFANGMEYFNTFGGNTVSCAVGLAVLGVVEEEGLQRRAAATGARLLAGLRGLMDRHPLIGDVRGHGLFLGFELVEDRAARTPAGAAAGWLVERARELGVLLSVDGPDHNVIKIKPPLCFGTGDADRLIAVVDDVLAEDPFRR